MKYAYVAVYLLMYLKSHQKLFICLLSMTMSMSIIISLSIYKYLYICIKFELIVEVRFNVPN